MPVLLPDRAVSRNFSSAVRTSLSPFVPQWPEVNKFGLERSTVAWRKWAQRPDVSGPVSLRFQANPGGGANPNKAIDSGLAPPLVGHFGTLGRNTLRINPSDIQAYWKPSARRFELPNGLGSQLQAHIYNVFNNTTFTACRGEHCPPLWTFAIMP